MTKTMGLLKYHILALIRDPLNLFFGLALPVLTMIMIPSVSNIILPLNIMITAMVLCFTDSALSHGYARQIKFLRRLRMTPVKSKDYVLTGMLSRYIVLIVFAVALILFAGLVINIDGVLTSRNWLLFFAALTLVYAMFYPIGMFVANSLKNPKSSQGLVYIVFFGLLILGGVWFPVALMPQILQNVHSVLPIAYGGELLINVWQGESILQGHYLIATAGVALVFSLLSIKFFKFE